jgi:hypothetical protein
VNDLFFLIHPNDIERNFCIFHPESPGLRLIEGKQHAVVFCQMFAVHQSFGAFLHRAGDLCLNDDPAGKLNGNESVVGLSAGRKRQDQRKYGSNDRVKATRQSCRLALHSRMDLCDSHSNRGGLYERSEESALR